ncbi:prolyl oligopeptidase family serine peptidase [Fulvivirgaceae bacterium BMA10]|uniref:Prolyl oligopeptidase family serine peptidase n=1 Tax=Splendidivirga corallicola TaxID=3051826 RepID=A0ABT8KN00_9BACT|nr:prolyl oligopeptidase family serine peptidase [Fulvivirgaceae bacterium BMA10]
MKTKISIFCIAILSFLHAVSQGQHKSDLTIKKIMQGNDFIGNSPGSIFWSEDGQKIYFNWNPDNHQGDSLYAITITDHDPKKVTPEERRNMPSRYGSYNKARNKKVYQKDGDLFLLDLSTGKKLQITNSLDREYNARFSSAEDRIIFRKGNNLFSWNIETGQYRQLTNFQSGSKRDDRPAPSAKNEKWLYEDQLAYFQILEERKNKRESQKAYYDSNRPKRPGTIYTGKKSISSISLSPDENYLVYQLRKNVPGSKGTDVPTYITETGYTRNLNARPKVGSPQTTFESWIYDVANDTSYSIKTSDIPGIRDVPSYYSDYKGREKTHSKDRKVVIHGPIWSDNGEHAAIVVRSYDNKDRWIMLLDLSTGIPKLLERQRDEAWVGGPGISSWNFGTGEIGWLPDNKTLWFQSEKTGYSHLYTIDVKTGKEKALTKGDYEIYDPFISKDKQYWYFTSNREHPGERHFYRMPVSGGKAVKLTSMKGRNDVVLSPDESSIAILHSFSNQPWELYLEENKEGSIVQKITDSQTEAFKTYSWRTPEIITFKADDGAKVHARLYRPQNPEKKGPAVIFVHGAGYLQNAHQWWSSYYREYMFHNLLVDHGYTVLDIDYRGSAGYGRDWRTGIYRFMGGKDLSDQVDGAKFLVDKYDIDPDRIGIYGGSYGGFITLMAMFTKPGVFKAGAALRSVTDWAHYNHGYTSNILNTPVLDSIAYAKSSPIYHAEGFDQGSLLICHGMIDTNVHFQDVVRLAQRLIELGKENWEFAVYPLESHGFVEPSSWTDEYRRIFELFEENLK